MDDRVLESQKKNVRIIVAEPDVLTVNDIADSLKNNLKLYSPAKKPEKRPIIHSFCASVPESPMLDVLASPEYTPRKRNLNSEISIQEVPISNSSKKSPPKRTLKKTRTSSSSRSQSCTPKKAPKIESAATTPSMRHSTRKKNGTLKKMESMMNTPSPRSSKRNTPKRVAAIKDEIMSSPKRQIRNSSLSRVALKDSVETPSPNKRKMTPSRVASPSPTKTPKTARRSINFSANQEVTVTRSGRKTKPVNYFEYDE